jgi:hypothetical protein
MPLAPRSVFGAIRRAERVRRLGLAAVASGVVMAAAWGPACATPIRLSARPSVSVMAGPSFYDLSRSGTAPAALLLFDLPIGPPIWIEAAFGYMRYTGEGSEKVTLLFPTLGARAGLLLGPLIPYVGAGAGLAAVADGPGDNALSLHAAGGFLVPVTTKLALRGEFRLRSIDPFEGLTAEVLGGAAASF